MLSAENHNPCHNSDLVDSFPCGAEINLSAFDQSDGFQPTYDSAYIVENKNKFFIAEDDDYSTMLLKIHYCPMCGRKL